MHLDISNPFEELFNQLFLEHEKYLQSEETEESKEHLENEVKKTGVKIDKTLLKQFEGFFDNVLYADYHVLQNDKLIDIVQELGTYFILSGLALEQFEENLEKYSFLNVSWKVYKKYTFLLGDSFLITMVFGEEENDPKKHPMIGITMHSNEKIFFNGVIYFDTPTDVSPKIAFERNSSVFDYSHSVLLKEMERYFVE